MVKINPLEGWKFQQEGREGNDFVVVEDKCDNGEELGHLNGDR
tara:strand:+ start:380 stop:508 length:129 start_codon:yes stop_codon:yes gene_type:complete